MQVKLFDEGVDHPNRVVFGDVVVEALGSKATWLRSSPSMNRFIPQPA
jgi:hypothetical protein